MYYLVVIQVELMLGLILLLIITNFKTNFLHYIINFLYYSTNYYIKYLGYMHTKTAMRFYSFIFVNTSFLF